MKYSVARHSSSASRVHHLKRLASVVRVAAEIDSCDGPRPTVQPQDRKHKATQNKNVETAKQQTVRPSNRERQTRFDHRWTEDGKPTCGKSNKTGHMYRECGQVKDSVKTAPVSQTSGN
jgi:hypothetical protein